MIVIDDLVTLAVGKHEYVIQAMRIRKLFGDIDSSIPLSQSALKINAVIESKKGATTRMIKATANREIIITFITL